MATNKQSVASRKVKRQENMGQEDSRHSFLMMRKRSAPFDIPAYVDTSSSTKKRKVGKGNDRRSIVTSSSSLGDLLPPATAKSGLSSANEKRPATISNMASSSSDPPTGTEAGTSTNDPPSGFSRKGVSQEVSSFEANTSTATTGSSNGRSDLQSAVFAAIQPRDTDPPEWARFDGERRLAWLTLLSHRPRIHHDDDMSKWIRRVMTISDPNKPLTQASEETSSSASIDFSEETSTSHLDSNTLVTNGNPTTTATTSSTCSSGTTGSTNTEASTSASSTSVNQGVETNFLYKDGNSMAINTASLEDSKSSLSVDYSTSEGSSSPHRNRKARTTSSSSSSSSPSSEMNDSSSDTN